MKKRVTWKNKIQGIYLIFKNNKIFLLNLNIEHNLIKCSNEREVLKGKEKIF